VRAGDGDVYFGATDSENDRAVGGKTTKSGGMRRIGRSGRLGRVRVAWTTAAWGGWVGEGREGKVVMSK